MTTSEVCFNLKEAVPDERKLKKALGGVYPAYQEILTFIDAYPREWKFYGPKFGWQLKVTQKGKALFYLTPQEGSFRLGFAVREKEKEVLLREVHQRVRNNLQVITSILDMSGRDPGNSVVRNTLAEARNKIYTMALIHAQLYEAERVDRIDMSRYIRELASHIEDMYSPKGTEITPIIRIDDVYLTMNQAIPCALILNELITNAYKHAFTGKPNGTITVSVKREADSRVVMEVGDDGRGLSAEKTAEGLGMKLVKNIVEVQLNGSLELSSEGGVLVRIEFDESDCVPG